MILTTSAHHLGATKSNHRKRSTNDVGRGQKEMDNVRAANEQANSKKQHALAQRNPAPEARIRARKATADSNTSALKLLRQLTPLHKTKNLDIVTFPRKLRQHLGEMALGTAALQRADNDKQAQHDGQVNYLSDTLDFMHIGAAWYKTTL